MLDLLCINLQNRIVDRNPSFFPEPHPAAFLLPVEKTMYLEQTQEASIQIAYDILLERAERRESMEYPPHTDNTVPARDENGLEVQGCYITQAIGVHE